MSRKIKLHIFNVLFQLFAYLADKTGGWRVFVRPKLLLGSLIMGLGLTSCGTKTENKPKVAIDPSKNQKTTNKPIDNKNKISVADSTTTDVSCYVIDVTSANERDQYVWNVPDHMPRFPGGDGKLMATLMKNINYPAIAKEDNIEGKVILGCVITETGEISDIVVLRSLDPACDKEAIRVAKLLPKWIPGKKDGENVNVSYILPVIFKLPKK